MGLLAGLAAVSTRQSPAIRAWARTSNHRISLDCLQKLTKRSRELPLPRGYLADLAQSFAQFRQFLKNIPRRSIHLTPSDEEALWQTYEPQRSPEHADLLVGAIRFLRPRQSRAWREPIIWEIRALCHAHRFKEAQRLAPEVGDLSIDNVRPVEFVRRQAEAVIEHREGVIRDGIERALAVFVSATK